MKRNHLRGLLALCLFATANAPAAVLYVDLNSATPTSPYTNWATAATNIQDAVDAAAAGDQILVTDGVYQTGGRAVFGTMTNRVAVDKPVAVQSVNGPQFTIIQGYQVPGTTNGEGAVRCVYLTSGASLSGFTLTNGATRNAGDATLLEQSGGGLWCETATATVSNCVLAGNSAFYLGGGASGGSLNNCTVSSNSASTGGGVFRGMLNNCTLTGNSAGRSGGGASGGTMTHCTLTGNSANHNGGGSDSGTLINCTLTGNIANTPGYFTNDMGGGGAVFSFLVNCTLASNTVAGGPPGGGALLCTLSNCTVIGNSGDSRGGGVAYSTLKNCALFGNLARFNGGASDSALDNCTIVGNSASISVGGVSGGILNNCIVYYNTAPSDANHPFGSFSDGTFNYSCTTPLPLNGAGSIANAPLFVDAANGDFRLQSNSPCINSGRNAYAPAGPDLDGNLRITGGTVDIGAYELQSPSSVLSYAWAQQYGLPTDGSADYTDSDGDHLNNWQEWIAGTVPTDASSALRVLNPSKAVSGVIVTWQSVNNRTYFLERATNLGAVPPFSLLISNLVGRAGTTSYTDPNATGPGPFFYRVGVQP